MVAVLHISSGLYPPRYQVRYGKYFRFFSKQGFQMYLTPHSSLDAQEYGVVVTY